MKKWILRLSLLALTIYGIRAGVAWIERSENERYRMQDDVARHMAEKRAGEVERALQSGSDVRAEALRRQVEEAGQARSLDTAGLR